MIKFKDLQKEDYEPVFDSLDNSMAFCWFKWWIQSGVTSHLNQDFSQSSFQKYLNGMENVPEVCTAYNILKKFKEEKNYAILSKIRIVPPNDNLPKKNASGKDEEVDLSEVKLNEAPKIVTDNQPQRVVYHNSVEIKVAPIKKEDTTANNRSHKKIGLTFLFVMIVTAAVVVYIKLCH